jgi:hypothetical protein
LNHQRIEHFFKGTGTMPKSTLHPLAAGIAGTETLSRRHAASDAPERPFPSNPKKGDNPIAGPRWDVDEPDDDGARSIGGVHRANAEFADETRAAQIRTLCQRAGFEQLSLELCASNLNIEQVERLLLDKLCERRFGADL